MCDKCDRQLRYWKRYWSRYNIMRYVLYESRGIGREYGRDYWLKMIVMPNITKVWNSNEMAWYNVCHMCDMKGLMNYGYDGGM